MAILVTGGCGYVGTKLVRALLERSDARVTVLDTMWFGNYLPSDPRLDVREGDVRAIDGMDLTGFDTIFHLAGVANDPAVELNPMVSWEINVLGTMRLVDKAARQGVRQFVFPSSGAVYGVRSEPRIVEDLDLMPISDYNKTKMVAERVILSYSASMMTTIFRPATVCGLSDRMRLDLTVNALTMHALSRAKMTVFGGSQVRPNIHIDDMVDLYLFARDTRMAGVFNAAFENLSVLDIARLVAERIPAEIETTPTNDPRSYRLCSDRLCATGFRPKKNVAAAVGELESAYRAGALVDRPNWHTVAWMKANNLGAA